MAVGADRRGEVAGGATGRADACGGVGCDLLVDVVDDDGRAEPCEFGGIGQAEPAARPGDDGDFAGEVH